MSEEGVEGVKVAIEVDANDLSAVVGDLSENVNRDAPSNADQSVNTVLEVLHLNVSSADLVNSGEEEEWEKRAEEEHQTHDNQQHEAEEEIMVVLQSLGLDSSANNLEQLANELEPVEAWELKAERTHSADEIDHKNASKEVKSVLESLGLSEADLLQSEAEEWEVRAEKQHAEIEVQRAEAEKEIDIVLQSLGIADSALYTAHAMSLMMLMIQRCGRSKHKQLAMIKSCNEL